LRTQITIQADGDGLGAIFGNQRILFVSAGLWMVRDFLELGTADPGQYGGNLLVADKPQISGEIQRVLTLQVLAGGEFAAGESHFVENGPGLGLK
jgi:hypothetical protein